MNAWTVEEWFAESERLAGRAGHHGAEAAATCELASCIAQLGALLAERLPVSHAVEGVSLETAGDAAILIALSNAETVRARGWMDHERLIGDTGSGLQCNPGAYFEEGSAYAALRAVALKRGLLRGDSGIA